MKQGILSFVVGALALTAVSAASARVNVEVGINPFGFGAYPPPAVVYQPDPYYYEPPPAVYFGGGAWGGDRGRPQERRDMGNRRGHPDGNRGAQGRGNNARGNENKRH